MRPKKGAFINAFLVVSGALFLATLTNSFINLWDFTSSIVGLGIYFILPAIGAAACLAGLYLPARGKVAIVLNLCAAVVACVGADLYVTAYSKSVQKAAESATGGAANQPADHDTRSLLEVILDLRREGIEAYPTYSPDEIFLKHYASNVTAGQRASRLIVDGEEVIPLTGVSNTTTAGCNETGKYLIYETDSMGFNNPPQKWETEQIDIATIGDSFVLGHCLPTDRNLVGVIREHYPDTVNVGVGGAGPLTDLAVLREYVAPMRPKKVIWVYFENDLENLEQEKRFPLMRRYLDKTFSQRIRQRRHKVEAVLRQYINDGLQRFQDEHDASQRSIFEGDFFATLLDVITLAHLREAVARIHVKAVVDFDLFRRVLVTAHEEVTAWGGELYFVYLSSWVYFYEGANAADLWRQRNRDKVLEVVGQLGIPVIDILPVFAEHQNQKRLFYGPGRHYTVEGYRLAAQAILRALGGEG